MQTTSQGSKDVSPVVGGLALKIAALIVILFLIVLDTAMAVFQLTQTSHGFPPAAWSVKPPDWID
jgi:hypothetical protein